VSKGGIKMSKYIPCNRKINVHHYEPINNKAYEEAVICFEVLGDGMLIPLVLSPNGFIRDLKINDTNSYLVVDGKPIEYSEILIYTDLIRKEEN
jgi:hypothetical protein